MYGDRGSIAKSTSIVILTSLVIIGVALLVWKVVNVLVLVFAASLLAILLYGLGSWVSEKTGASYAIGFAAAVLIVAAAAVGALWLLGSQIASQFNQLSSIIPQAWDQLQGFLKDRFWGSAIIDEVRNFNLASWASNVAFVAVGALADIILIVVGAVYLAAQPDLYRRGLMALVPRSQQQRASETLHEIRIALLQWLKAQLISMVIVGTLTVAGLWVLGMPSSIALGVIAGFAEFIPYVGPFLAFVPAILVAISEGGSLLVWVPLLYLAIQQIESNLVMPIVTRELVYLPPALTVFSIVALGIVFGPLGVILAAPLTVLLYVLVGKLYVEAALKREADLPSNDSE